MQPSKSVFENTNKNDNTNNNTWGNPQLGNKPFQWPSNSNNESVFKMWPNNNTMANTNSNPFCNNTNTFQSVFTNNHTNNTNNTNTNNLQSAFTNNTKNTTNAWWSSNTTNTNTNTNTKPSNINGWSTNTQTIKTDTTNNHMEADNDNDIDVGESATNTLTQKHTFNTKSKPTKLEATPESQPFLGNWHFGAKNYQGKTPIVFVTIRHKQTDPNQLIGLVNNHPKHNLKITSFGIAARTESSKVSVLRGILHVSVRDKGALSVLWHDDSDNHQHYWNQAKCKGFESGSGHCQYGINCRFAHVNDGLTQRLQANNKRVMELQQKKQNKKQQSIQSRYEHNNIGLNGHGRHKGKDSMDMTEHKSDGSFKTTNGLHVSPKRPLKVNTNAIKRLLPQPRALKSYKNALHREEGMSFTTTYFNSKGDSVGTYISTQDEDTSNTIGVPRHKRMETLTRNEENAGANGIEPTYRFDDQEQHNDNNNDMSSPSPSVDVNEVHEPGKCYLMCAQSESDFRISNGLCNKVFERDSSGDFSKYSLIKEYSKSNAGQMIGLKDVRCGSVLRLTMQYLMNITLNDIHAPFRKRYVFLEDRIRAICKDIYAGHLMKIDGKSTIELLETAVRFRICCHVLMCHMDQTVSQQKRVFPASTSYQSPFLNHNINVPVDSNDLIYSSANNLNHLHNMFKWLLSLYKCRDFDGLSPSKQHDEVTMYCLHAYYMLVNGAMNYREKRTNYHYESKEILCKDVPRHIRKQERIKLAHNMIDAYTRMNRALFFKLYHNRLSFMEQCVLYPILDSFRLHCIKKMCNRGNIRLAPNTTYRFTHFVRGFGFYDGNTSPSVDATDFLIWFGAFEAHDITRICNNGLTMDDFGRIKPSIDGQRFAARDWFLLSIDHQRNGLQQLLQSSSYCNINQSQFHTVFASIENASDINIVNQNINNMYKSMVKPSPVITAPPSKPSSSSSSAFGSGFDINFLKKHKNAPPLFPLQAQPIRREATATAPQPQAQQAFKPNNGASLPLPLPPSQSTQAIEGIPPIEAIHSPPPPPARRETIDDIKSSHDSSLQSMLDNQEWKPLFVALSDIKKQYETHVLSMDIQLWIESYFEKQRIKYKNEWNQLNEKESKRNWIKFYRFIKKWNPIVPNDVKVAMRDITKHWFKFKKNETVYYKNCPCKITNICFNLKKETPPIMKIMKITKEKHKKVINIDMFSDEIISEKEHMLRKEQEEIKRKQEMERKQREYESKMRALAEEKRLNILRAKLAQEERKKQEKKAAEVLVCKQILALKKCNEIYSNLRLKRFINEWKCCAFEIGEIRKHYRLNHNDDILNKSHGQSMNETLLLLQSHKESQSPRSRKRRKPDYDNDDDDDRDYFELRRLTSCKRQRLNRFSVSWNYIDIMSILYESNCGALAVNDSSSYVELIFNILISSDSRFVLKHFGCDDVSEQVSKRVFVDEECGYRLHFCVITDVKIRSIGATFCNSIIGFQSYVHVISACAVLDFDIDECVWSLNGDRKDAFLNDLRKERDRIGDNLGLLDNAGECAVLILMECQALYTNIRDNRDAMNTLIEFNDDDFLSIVSALDIVDIQNDNIAMIGIPKWATNETGSNAMTLPFNYGMQWIAQNGAKYPKMYKTKSNIVSNMFEKIFDSSPHALSQEQKIVLWNGQITQIASCVADGICSAISWPPSCFDDEHELMINEVLPPRFWNNNETKNRILSSLTALKIMDEESELNPKRYIIHHLADVDKYWWTINDIVESIDDFFTQSSISDASTFNTLNTLNTHHMDDNDNDNVSANRNSLQLMQFDELLIDISNHADSTLQGLKTCCQVIHSINNRINALQ